jgi:hypothetical protein
MFVMRYCLLVLVTFSCGCSLLKSRYAMDDPVYAEKYEKGAERGDLLGKAKQALDARHTEGLGGRYFGGGAQINPRSGSPMGGLESGAEGYPANWMTGRGALSLFAGEDDAYGGLDLGLRLQSPTRVAAFVGVGTFHGASRKVEDADDDGIDNDDDGWIDEYGEDKESFDGWLSSIYPEIGTHLWINGRWRLTGYGRYLITTEGRQHDDWLLGIQLARFSREHEPEASAACSLDDQ